MNTPESDQSVDLQQFAEMTGFPIELVKKELFGENEPGKEVSLSDLREAMLNYLDSTMMDQ